MRVLLNHRDLVIVCGTLLLFIPSSGANAQDWQVVWGDEFDEPAIDRSKWTFDTGPINDTVHYFTDRSVNARVEDGKLHIIAQKESYEGFEYTAALLKTSHAASWRYGRVEARIKLPGTNGFVPAFWMLPADDLYGWWPWGGEIDILEHPTNQVDRIYGTVHTGAYNSFTGSSPRGSHIRIHDAESAFHLYAIEWTADRMDFYVDEQMYFSFHNDHQGFATWPFDQPFYLILSMGVGGGWVGNPDATSVFPAVMEVDYVRVYQRVSDVTMQGADFVLAGSTGSIYSVPAIDGASYAWSVPGDALPASDPHRHYLAVDWGELSGEVVADIVTPHGVATVTYPVKVSSNVLKNAGFEKGVKYWSKTGPYPAQADFTLSAQEVHDGHHSLYVDVRTPGIHAWDAQLSQRGIHLDAGQPYHASFWAKTTQGSSDISAAVIHATDYTLYAVKTLTLGPQWEQYHFDFTAPADVNASFNLDLGGHTGQYFFDSFVLTTPQPSGWNQIINGDFFEGDAAWILNTWSTAQATGSVEQGEYAVDIHQGGNNAWDVHLGQTGLLIEKGKKYTVSFDAYAAVPRQISALVSKNTEPWTVYSGNQSIALTTSRQTYTYTFTMNQPTDPQARLGFDIGASSINVYFDNVLLKPSSGRE
jgi:beta-glucanase (GH16 family)